MLTSNPQVLSWLRGIKFNFISSPPTRHSIKEPKLTRLEHENCKKLIDSMLEMGAISRCTSSKTQYVSSYFLRQKTNGEYRFILNLKSLNCHLEAPHFKLEDYRTAIKLTYPGCFFTLVDLRDAYFSIQINEKYRKFLRFCFQNELFQFNSLPFGLCSAPFIFTKIMKPVLHFLRTRDIICVCYLDDFFLISPTMEKSKKDITLTLQVLTNLGFNVNYDKSQLNPNNTCCFLGFFIDSKNMRLSLPSEKSQLIISLINDVLLIRICSIKLFAKIIGHLVAACPAVRYGPLYIKSLEGEKYKALKSGKSYNHNISLSRGVRSDLEWWQNSLACSYVPIFQGNYDITIFTDASNSGWGGSCNNENIHGFWLQEESKNHINWLELAAAFHCLKAFTKSFTHMNILLKIDNVTAIALINKMGSVRHRKLNTITRHIWQYCESKGLYIFATYISSKNNKQADSESRCKNIDTEYELNNIHYKRLCRIHGTPQIDLFASRINAKCARYNSWKPDPGASGTDSFTTCWSQDFFYAFPPFSLILKMLNKIIMDKAEGLVVVPWWPTQPWFPLFKRLVVGKILFFKPSKTLLLSPFRKPHPLWRTITLAAGHLSGKPL